MRQGTVLEIQRMSTEDGPGIRTTVFLKGCPLACIWCHNPESILAQPQVHRVASRCIGCDICIATCPVGALHKGVHGIEIDRLICNGCGVCANECPSTAMELLGRQQEADKLVAELVKDKAFFEHSGGGVTISGGEPVLQADFASAVLKMLKEQGIHTAIDTCGLCSRESIEKLMPYTDMVLFDIKVMDADLHRKFTGASNAKIIDTLLFIRDYIRRNSRPQDLWIRTPIIPGATDAEWIIKETGRFIGADLADVVNRWELCAFNNLCKDKYTRLGLEWVYHDSQLLRKATMEKLADAAKRSGVDPSIVRWSGTTRLEDDE